MNNVDIITTLLIVIFSIWFLLKYSDYVDNTNKNVEELNKQINGKSKIERTIKESEK